MADQKISAEYIAYQLNKSGVGKIVGPNAKFEVEHEVFVVIKSGHQYKAPSSPEGSPAIDRVSDFLSQMEVVGRKTTSDHGNILSFTPSDVNVDALNGINPFDVENFLESLNKGSQDRSGKKLAPNIDPRVAAIAKAEEAFGVSGREDLIEEIAKAFDALDKSPELRAQLDQQRKIQAASRSLTPP